MSPEILTFDCNEFVVIFHSDGSKCRWSGKVVEIQTFADGTWIYQSNKSSDFTRNIEDARIWFEWSFCWRGVWEGRVYFKDSEYWGEEMEIIPLIWKEIESKVKARIRQDNQDNKYMDE